MINSTSIIPTSDLILRKAMYQAFDEKCFYSGKYLLFEEIHIDHINPKINGGKDCIENYVLCSPYINKHKNDKIDLYFIERITLINKLLFVDNVINNYNNMMFNKCINDEFNYSVDEFCKKYNIKISGKNKIIRELTKLNKLMSKKFVKTTGVISSKNKYYSNFDLMTELKKLYKL